MPDDTIHSEQDFLEALGSLVRTAEANGVAVGGGWTVLYPDDSRGWDVEIVELAPREDDA